MSFSHLSRVVMVVGLVSVASPAFAQQWTGGYIGGHVGFSRIPEGSDNTVVFDRNLDGTFNENITTAAGANAFSPGFCVGAAATALPAGGCTQDDDGPDFGGRAGYDWQMGRFVIGAVGDLSFADHVDSVSAFSTTPAFYTFTRELNWVSGFRGRAGFGAENLLIYGTGGLAWASLDHSFATSNAVNTAVEDAEDMAWGYQLGGGAQFRFGTSKFSAGAEYLWTMLNDEDRYTVRLQGPAPATNAFILGNAGGSDLRRDDAFEFGSIRFVLGYRF